MGFLFAFLLLTTSCSNTDKPPDTTTNPAECIDNYSLPCTIEMNESIYYYLNGNHLCITGSGPAYGGSGGKFPWKYVSYIRDNAEHITVAGEITLLSPYSFSEMEALSCEINCPVGTLGMACFQGSKVISVNLSQCTFQTLPIDTFMDCSSLQIVHLPASLERIGSFAFYNCPNLTTIVFHGSQQQWNSIIVENGNEQLLNVNVIFEKERKERDYS